MRLLLDTHAFIWWLCEDPRLSARARRAIAKKSNEVWVSAASVWEMAMKAERGRLPSLARRVAQLPVVIRDEGFKELPISAAHALRAPELTFLHRDPFDRMLVAQAELEQLVLVSNDSRIAAAVETHW